MNKSIFEQNESCVRSYCRKYPVIFTKAKGSHIYDEFVSAKEKECDKFRTYVTPLEVEMYLNMQ